MQYKKLTQGQRNIKRWRDRRNKLVGKLLAENPRMMGHEALKIANEMMRKK